MGIIRIKARGIEVFERKDERKPSVEKSKEALIEDEDILVMEEFLDEFWNRAE